MNGQNMMGVVIWADKAAQSAVIWCEDHGDLAYYSAKERSVFEGMDVESGDLIEFNMTQHSKMRYASNLRLVASQDRPELACALAKSGSAPKARRAVEPASNRADNLVEFPRLAVGA